MSPVENRQIADVKEDIQALIETMGHVKAANDRIELLLIGDKFTENKGLIHKVDAISERLSTVEKMQSAFKSKWAGIVLVIVAISGVTAFLYYASSFFHNLSK